MRKNNSDRELSELMIGNKDLADCPNKKCGIRGYYSKCFFNNERSCELYWSYKKNIE